MKIIKYVLFICITQVIFTLLNSSKSKNLKNSSEANLHNKSNMKFMNLFEIKNLFKSKKSKIKKQIDLLIEFSNLKDKIRKKEKKRLDIDYSLRNSIFDIPMENEYPKFKNKENENLHITYQNQSNLKNSLTSKISKTNHDVPNYYKFNDSETFEDWFMISSSEFLNEKKFPLIKLSNGQTIGIKHDENNFRINLASNCNDSEKPANCREFYFRLNKQHLYYSSTKTDINILGSIDIFSVKSLEKTIYDEYQKELYCYIITDKNHSEWKICSCNKEKVVKFYCILKFFLGDYTDSICIKENSNNCKKVEKKIIQPIIIIPLPSRQCNEGWNYLNKGNDWECQCSEGKEQSPIDLPATKQAIESPVKPLFYYKSIPKISDENNLDSTVLKGMPTIYKVFDNKLMFKQLNLGKLVTLDGAVYRAEDIAFHSPSQHTINGERFDLEMTIIHNGISKGDIGNQATLSFLFKKTPGAYNLFFEALDIFNFPTLNSPIKPIINSLDIRKVLFSKEDKEDYDYYKEKCFDFYTYQGSVMFPPCTERTIVYVASNPIPLSSTIIQLIKESISISGQEAENYRETKSKNGRPVFHYKCEDCIIKPPKKTKKIEEGHYEKIERKLTQFYFVNGNEPSGLPGSFVVSENKAKGIQ